MVAGGSHLMDTALGASEIIGSYRIDGLIGSGGMGSVYRADHLILARRAAIKVLNTGGLDKSLADRLLQEARILASIDDPTIVELYDAGLLPDGRPWLAMELLDGPSLAEHLMVHQHVESRECAQIVLSVAEALARAHAAGVIHRDVKPENIMLVPGPHGRQVKLIDWGIAQLTTVSRRLTQPDCSPGTPCYMSPEQLRGEAVDGRTDLYALGVIAYEMLTGDPPFDGATSMDIAVKVLRDPVPPLVADVPASIVSLIMAMLEKTPELRPSLEAVRIGFAEWHESPGDDYAEMSIEMEIEADFEANFTGPFPLPTSWCGDESASPAA
jgi:eukaryotic-like serine/threonine-protein kinase